uniref:Rho-GAP domain-containing protein n=1 Tax=Cyprinus carpio TaxID=7962 RepID=A0A8C2EG50_CYPCA
MLERYDLWTDAALSPSSPVCFRDCSLTAMNVESWADPRDPQPDSPDLPTPQQPDSLCLESFWSEVETIRSDSEPDSSRRDSRQSEDGEQEELWLQDAGLSPLVTGEEEDVDKAVLLSTLTKTQAAAVQRRIDSYTCSLRKRNKTPARHVRDIFASPIAQVTAHLCVCSVTKTQRSGTNTHTHTHTASFLLAEKLIRLSNNIIKTLRVICPQCRLGVTRVLDLSQQDMKKVRQLALIDMTALCDLLGLEVKRHKTCKRKIPESCLFGVPLASLVESDQKIKPNTQIPLFLQTLLSFLEKKGLDSEGILRVPGSQARIKVLQQKLENSFYSGSFSWDEVSPNDAAALLKKFIRELPAPLLTAEHLNSFSAVRDIADLKQKLHMLNLLVLLLPEPNRNTLKALLEFLSKVVLCERRNRMNLWAVSTIMAPNLFLHKAVPSKLAVEGPEKGQAERAADIMRLLVRYQDLLWTVKIWRTLRRHSMISSSQSAQESLICSSLADVSFSMEFRLTINSRASDLMSQFYKELHTSDNSRGLLKRIYLDYNVHYIFLYGSGEHCLDPETHLFDLYNNNPGGEWIIKLRSSSRGQ